MCNHPTGSNLQYLQELAERFFAVVKNSLFHEIQFMSQLSNRKYDWHQRGCALVVVIAVCALTVKLTTRFASFDCTSTPAVTTVQPHVSPSPNRQRLMNTATAWNAPLIRPSLLDSTSSYPRIAPAGPPMPSVLVEESLYNRPPPVFIPA